MARCAYILGAVFGAGLLLAAPARAQDNSGQTQQKQTQSQAGDRKKDQKKPTAQENPFPEEKSEAAAKQAQQQEQREEQDEAPAAPAPQTAPKGSTAARNPFPEEQSEKAAGRNQQKSGEPGGNESGKDGFSSSQVNGLELPGAGSRAGSPSRLDPELAKKDTQVGLFYLQTGDFKGAYDRFAEATRSDPGNADAVYGLGESAAHLGNRNQALSEFRLYLSALPDGPHAKDIRKEMKKMGVEPPK